MKAVSYTRKNQFTQEVENYVGVFDSEKSKRFDFVKIYHPIINGVVMRGVCHTNAENVQEVTLNAPVKNSLTGQLEN